MRIVRDPNSKTGLSALVLLRDIKMRGPLSHGRYVLVDRKFSGKYPIDFGGQKRKPRVAVTIDWQPSAIELQMQLNRKKLERARANSPMLK